MSLVFVSGSVPFITIDRRQRHASARSGMLLCANSKSSGMKRSLTTRLMSIHEIYCPIVFRHETHVSGESTAKVQRQ